ncbi:transposable element tc3 transposase-like protein, partial [Dinothrombium tinctorium]
MRAQDWQSWVFTDEKVFQSYANGTFYVWRQRKERYNPRFLQTVQKSGRFSVYVHGWISYNGLGNITFINGNMNSAKYCEILKEQLPLISQSFAGQNFTFIQDKHPSHFSNETLSWIENFKSENESIRFTLDNWVSKGADLNIIENVWHILQDKVCDKIRNLGIPQNEMMLRIYILNSWNEIQSDLTICETLYNSLPSRFR